MPTVTKKEKWLEGQQSPDDLCFDLSSCSSPYPESTFNAVKTSFSQIALIKILLLFIIIRCLMSYLVALSGIPPP